MGLAYDTIVYLDVSGAALFGTRDLMAACWIFLATQELAMRVLTIMPVGVSPSLASCGKEPGAKGDPDHKVPQDLRGHRAYKECPAHRGNREHRVRRDRRALLVKREIRAKKEKRAIRARRAILARVTKAIVERKATRATLATQCAPFKLMVK
jgi:hypothetical protein